jgi:hypothetical protein
MTMTFKVGDKVVRINHDYGLVKVGDTVEVSGVWPDEGSLSIRGDTRITYDINQFVLAKLVPPTKDVVAQKPSNPKEAIGDTKLNLSLVPDTAHMYLASAFTEGALKYGSYNWRAAGVRASTYVAACRRHLAKWWNGEEFDPKTKVHHLANAMACLAIILDAKLVSKLNDDRPPVADIHGLIESLEGTVAHLKEMSKGLTPHHYTANDAEPR